MAGRMQLGEKATEAMAGRIDAAPGQDHAKSIICAICDTPAFESPVKAAGCGHLFDKGCLAEWLRGKDGDRRSCPVCRTVLPPGDAAYTEAEHFVKEIIAGIKVDCPQGCEQPQPKRMRYDTLAAHLRACPNTPMLCGNAHCERVVPQREVAAHAAECQLAPVRCVQCDKELKRKAMQDHLNGDCLRRRYQCGYCKEGDIVFANKDAHEQTCPGQVPVGWVADLRQQNRKLTEENGGLKEETRGLKEENRKLQQRNKEQQEKHAEELKAQGRELQLLRMLQERSRNLQEAQGRELQELRKQNAELQQNVRIALCCRIKVSSKEKPTADGEYTILPERQNGHRVWGGDRGYVYKGEHGYWTVAPTRADVLSGKGYLATVDKDNNDYPTVSGKWQSANASHKWEAAPGTTVTAV